MRSKTDEKRNAIIAAATAVFEEVGYQRASMTMIAARLGGSKATLYGYFHSKEQLFATVVISALEETGEELQSSLASRGDVATVLARYGRIYLALVTRPEIMAIQRTVLSEGQGTTLGKEVYELGPKRGLIDLTEFLQTRANAGELDLASPEVAAFHLKGLLEAGVTEPLLFGLTETRDKDESVKTAVAAFMRIYGKP
ncbi:TetR/AcrR family transcriptional regulator C-terminal domain-containing protein [Pleomorphomonas sp. PLEO]|uniref:TetR/AcrR family transcriptional regulator C-terminal domain-containing protein n=1 Tax=Pleomorphomonas sp. PLEO TaxID=3239306 RepID=UPI00351E7032